MIKYKLICKDCELLFDSWFASSEEYEKLKKRNFWTAFGLLFFMVFLFIFTLYNVGVFNRPI